VSTFHILHVDDDPDLREIVKLSLGLDPAMSVESCGRADEALARAADVKPDLVLCDVVMPEMDGPALVARLSETSDTADIPVVFMTARREPSELERLRALGAAGVIAKPFNPAMLAASVRRHLRFAKLANMRDDFVQRLRRDAATFARLREDLERDGRSPSVLEDLQSTAHKLCGTAGVFDFLDVSAAAAELEESVIDRRSGAGAAGMVEDDLDALIRCIDAECASET
jgi:CheY-like chemotaxis protein